MAEPGEGGVRVRGLQPLLEVEGRGIDQRQKGGDRALAMGFALKVLPKTKTKKKKMTKTTTTTTIKKKKKKKKPYIHFSYCYSMVRFPGRGTADPDYASAATVAGLSRRGRPLLCVRR